ncbi:hypothetical protein [Methylosinus sp. PW1]|uniref:hypothetical protein n=1 Tax=Methylosinus sp. PW1 TaxID=107636 RepID=UPI000AC46281|nr:hypothetical protein [Methylosinus sp. PW1]
MTEIINRPTNPQGDKDLANGWYWLAIGIGNKEKRPVELKDGVWQWGYAGGGFPKTCVFVLSRVEDPEDAVEAGYYWGRFRSDEPSDLAWIFDVSESGQVRWNDNIYNLSEIEIVCRVPTPGDLAELERLAKAREPGSTDLPLSVEPGL